MGISPKSKPGGGECLLPHEQAIAAATIQKSRGNSSDYLVRAYPCRFSAILCHVSATQEIRVVALRSQHARTDESRDAGSSACMGLNRRTI